MLHVGSGTSTSVAVLHRDAGGGLYRGAQGRDGTPVLVKFLRGDSPDPREVQRLHHEYEILCQLRGPWVLRPQGLERERGWLRLVLEGFEGEPLSQLAARPMDLGRVLDIVVPLTEAVADLHRQGIVHLDIRPGNVLVDARTGALKLIGLGLAVRLSGARAEPVRPAVIEGSPAYMSPEQTGYVSRGIDQRSDLYSLGIVLYELLTGQLPFQAGDPVEWAHRHVARLPTPPTQIVPSLPAGVVDVVLKLLAKQPGDRYQTARGLLADLRHCRAQWSAAGTVPAFPLASQDAGDQFRLPPRYYGREREAAALVAGFERVRAGGGRALLLVAGYSGIGKSSLVQQVRGPVTEAHGYFASAKDDRYQRDIPYATLARAVDGLLQQILTEPPERVEQWRVALREALGSNGRLIVELLPRLELLIGPQPGVPALPPSEAQQRFQRVFGRFLGAFARREHPLVLFLDDLQWVDPASLALVSHLLASPDVEALLLIGAYRDNEVGPAHPLTAVVTRIRRSEAWSEEVTLTPLSPALLAQLVADTLRRPVVDVEPLARLIYGKTGGNPFFTLHFLTTLHQEGLLAYDVGDGEWQWDLPAIRRQGFTDNVVELMLGRLKRLPGLTREVLTQAACLASTVEATTLALLSGRTVDQLHGILREALDDGLLSEADGTYTFLHDRVQEAAYDLLDPSLRPQRHLQIGRTLLAHLSQDRLVEEVFEVVGQLNHGASLITSPTERQRLAELNLVAGRRAKATSAFASALTYLTAGMTLLDAQTWQRSYALSFALHVERAECEYLTGNFSCSDDLLTLTVEHAQGRLDKALAYRLRQRLYQLSGQWPEAMRAVLEALRLFEISLPDDDQAIMAATDAEITLIQDTLRRRSIADLADVPLSDDSQARALIGLLGEAMPLIFGTRPTLWPLVTAKGVNACLQCGHAEESPFVYSCYAMVLAGVRRDIRAAHQFSDLALQLNERLASAAAWRGKLLLHHGALVTIWTCHFATGLPLLDQAFDACVESGDLLHANYITYNMIWLHLENCDRLDEVAALAHRLADFARLTKNDVVHQVDRLLEQFVLALQGKTSSPTDFGDTGFDEADCVAAIERADFGLGLGLYSIAKQVAAFQAGRFDEALEWADRMAPVLIQVASFAAEATYYFYRALTLTALHAQADRQQRHQLEQWLREPLEKLEFWAASCPDNFADRYALVRAELARIEGRDGDALCLYDQAIVSAQESGFARQAALAAELASRYCRSRGMEWTATTYLRSARDYYSRWGAEGVVLQIDRQHPGLVCAPSLAPGEVLSARTEQFDLLSVVKASQAISGEIVLPNLQQALVRLALEQAGAQRGFLLLADGEHLSVSARAETEGGRTRVDVFPAVPISCEQLPLTLVNYVARSGATVVLTDASTDVRYGSDEYFRTRQSGSVLGLPIARQGELIGILYLENNLITGAFNPRHLAVLELLAAQAAISLETARLYSDLQRENVERHRAETEVRQLNHELEQRVLDRTAQLQTTNQDLEAFASTVSHDLRAPLRAIHGFTRILREDHGAQLDDDACRLLVKVQERSERMRQLIDDLLSFSRVGHQGMSQGRVDLGAVVQKVIRDAEPELRGREVRWCLARLPVVSGDEAMLRVVLINLVSNALKFTRSRKPAEIEIGMAEEACAWTIFVRDNGVGFDRRQADRLFGVFQRLHLETEYEGTGIGLATVRRIIERHGGRTWAESQVDGGATVAFTLPRGGSTRIGPPVPAPTPACE